MKVMITASKRKVYFLKAPDFDLCTTVSLFLCIYLTAVTFSRRWTPILMIQKSHLILLVGYLSAAADIVDFADYSNKEEITKLLGVNTIWGLKAYFELFL